MPLTVNIAAGLYEGLWNLMDASLTTRKTYRIRVLQGTTELAAMSVDAIRGRWGRTASTGTTPLATATILPIRFHVAMGAAIIPATTKLLDASAFAHMTAVGLSSLTFATGSSMVASIDVGDVVVAGISQETPYGLLRKVVAKQVSNNQVILQTATASLEEAIQQGRVHFSAIPLTPDIAAPSSFALPPVAGSSTASFRATRTNFQLGQYVTVSTTFAADITLSGDLVVQNHQLQVLELSAEIKKTLSLDAKTALTIAQFTDFATLATWQVRPIVVYVGILPIVLVPTIELQLGATGNIKGGISTKVDMSHDATYGFRYDAGAFSPIWMSSYSFTVDPFQPIIDADLKVLLGPKLSVSPYLTPAALQQLGITASASLELSGMLHPKVHILTDPWWELYGGVEAAVGVDFRLWGARIIGKPRVVLADFEVLLKKGTSEVIISPRFPTVGVGQSTYISAVVRDQSGTFNLPNRPITWISRDPRLADVTPAGATATVTGNRAGHVWIVAASGLDLDSVNTNVTGGAISISPSHSALQQGAMTTLTATTSGLPQGTTVNWRSLDQFVMMGPTGCASGLTAGVGRIVATAGAFADTATVDVSALPSPPPVPQPGGTAPIANAICDGNFFVMGTYSFTGPNGAWGYCFWSLDYIPNGANYYVSVPPVVTGPNNCGIYNQPVTVDLTNWAVFKKVPGAINPQQATYHVWANGWPYGGFWAVLP